MMEYNDVLIEICVETKYVRSNPGTGHEYTNLFIPREEFDKITNLEEWLIEDISKYIKSGEFKLTLIKVIDDLDRIPF